MDFIISKGHELNIFQSDKVIFISADGNYSHVHTVDGYTKMVTVRLGEVEQRLEQQGLMSDQCFMRVGRTMLVNTRYISTLNLKQNNIVLHNGKGVYTPYQASRVALQALRKHYEKKMIV